MGNSAIKQENDNHTPCILLLETAPQKSLTLTSKEDKTCGEVLLTVVQVRISTIGLHGLTWFN